ncbi:hypothetical protein NDU88_001763 [Pleurodeles waltl]|uniref:Uncharacterized protein n=1 Tax=Pleurodeles waltl TaxID=8319 RepID=A0AAV7TL14_PLEWA|nr:hypothetical protein NDU88_001763 [Pleurodeles waltl]
MNVEESGRAQEDLRCRPEPLRGHTVWHIAGTAQGPTADFLLLDPATALISTLLLAPQLQAELCSMLCPVIQASCLLMLLVTTHLGET